jgi:hypothetical protein
MKRGGPNESEMIVLSEVDASVYAKSTRPAIDSGVTLTVEDEARGLYRRILKSEGGERQNNIGALHSELRILRRNQSQGYRGWEFRVSVLERTLELLGVM